VIRALRFLQPMTVSILSGRRRVPPYGLAGGDAAAVGRNSVQRGDGRVEELAATSRCEVTTGDIVLIETPGGGGYGAA
jgi:5-oxoprolinase (ATP-hydrolysing)